MEKTPKNKSNKDNISFITLFYICWYTCLLIMVIRKFTCICNII